MSSYYYIRNCGCDDITCGLSGISDEFFPTFKATIENLNKNSTYGCMPTIEIYKVTDKHFFRPADRNEDDNDVILYIGDQEWVYTGDLWKNEGLERVV